MSRTDAALALVVAVGLAAALPVCINRWRAEAAYRTVSVVVDGSDAARIAAGTPESLESVLRALARSGATAVAVTEQTLDDLVADGSAAIAPAGFSALEAGPAGGPVKGLWISFPGDQDGRLANAVVASLRAKMPRGRVQTVEGALIFRGSAQDLKDVGLALPADVIFAAHRAGLDVVARIRNYPRASPEGIGHMMDMAAAAGARIVIFEADQVVGYRNLLRRTADALESQPEPLVYGYIELARQMGNQSLGRLLQGRLVRVHSILPAELAKMSPRQAVARFVRAAKERNVRVCYVRLFQTALSDPGADDYQYVDALATGLKRAGFRLGPARPMPPLSVPAPCRVVMMAGITAAAVMLLRMILPIGGRLSWLLLALGLGMGALLLLARPDLACQEKAFLAVLVFPTLGTVAVGHWMAQVARRSALSPWRITLAAAALLVGVSVCSLMGGVFVAALLAEREYLVGVEQFRGVKAASLLPVLGLALVVIGRMDARQPRGYLKRILDNLLAFSRRPVLRWEIAAGLCVLAAALYFIVRTGNEAAVPPSGLELRVRELLEQALVVRPRTKEFLFGHPALMLAVAATLRGAGGWAAVLLLAGAVGQVSIANTFCHLHTPLGVSLLRTFNGLWLGTVIGALVVLAGHFVNLLRRT